jgi:polar amino acid transport system permease protein
MTSLPSSTSWRTWIFLPHNSTSIRPAVAILNAFAVFLLLSLALTLCFQGIVYSWNWPAIWRYRALFWNGWITTVLIALGSLAASLLLGLIMALARRSSFILLRYAATVYVAGVRGTPLLVQILLLFYVVANALRAENRYFVGGLALSIFSAAYISEIIRAGIESVGRSQLDAARAVGFNRFQTYRFVIAPQALRQMLPPLAGEFASLIKNSSLLSIIAVNEFTLNAQQVNAYTYGTLESYLPLAVGYLILTLPISLLSRWLERSSHYET